MDVTTKFEVALHLAGMPIRVTASQDVMFGLDALRVYLPEAGFAELIGSLVTRCEHGQLSQTLESLRCLYGDL